jgi:hypothetical protein
MPSLTALSERIPLSVTSAAASAATSLSEALASLGAESNSGELPERVARTIAHALGVPVALLRRTAGGWRFEAAADVPGRASDEAWRGDRTNDVTTHGRWTGVLIGLPEAPTWILLLPGAQQEWRTTSFISDIAPRLGRVLERSGG